LTTSADPATEADVPVRRPPVDVVVPFAGSEDELWSLVARASKLVLGPQDTIVVVDNGGRRNRGAPGGPRGASVAPGGPREPPPPGGPRVRVLEASERRSSYHARNRGAAAGQAPWLLFLDADVDWPPNLIDAYFDSEPGERVAVLAGGITDAPTANSSRATAAERYAAESHPMAQINTLGEPRHPPYAQTANCLVRRAAFESVGAFADGIRSGGDADLCFRLQADGWTVEPREAAGVVHRNRRALIALLAQKARHGAGAAWLAERYPGAFPRRRWTGLAAWSVRSIRAGRRRGSGGASMAVVDVLAVWAFELGRLLPNRPRPLLPNRPRPRRSNRTRRPQ
jgi:GT2 family glycosyltransferase